MDDKENGLHCMNPNPIFPLLYNVIATSFHHFYKHSQNASQAVDPGSDMLAICWMDWIPGLNKPSREFG